ncbi:hypothetical protein BHM03_00008592, partial [Ensete ventricosum]
FSWVAPDLVDPCLGQELQDPVVGGNDRPEPVEGQAPDDGIVFVMQRPLPDLGSRIGFRAEELLPSKAGSLKMTSICFSIGP